MAVNDVVAVAVRGTLYNYRWQTGFHVQYKTAIADAVDCANNVETNLIPLLQAACGDDVNFDSIRVMSVAVDGAESLELALPAATNGTITGESPPGQCPAIISLRTGVKGRRRRGRMFIPAGVVGHLVAGRWTAASLNGLQGLAGGFSGLYATGGSEAGTYQAVVYSPADPNFVNKKGVHTRPTELITDVSNCQPSEYAKTLHRRAIGVGQ